MRISPVRLFSADGPDREKLDFLLANVRGEREREGDIFAQSAANDVAARRFAELVERYGADTLRACFDRLHVESETQMRAAIQALPDGVYEGEDWVDDDGVDDRPLRVHVRRSSNVFHRPRSVKAGLVEAGVICSTLPSA